MRKGFHNSRSALQLNEIEHFFITHGISISFFQLIKICFLSCEKYKI